MKTSKIVFRTFAVLAATASAPTFAATDFAVLAAVKASTVAITAAVATTTTAVAASALSINAVSTLNFQTLNMVIKGAAVEQAQATSEAAKMTAQAQVRSAFQVEAAKVPQRYVVTDPCTVIAAQAGMAQVSGEAVAAGTSIGRGGGGSSSNASGGGGGGVRAGMGGANADLEMAVKISKGLVAAPAPEVAAKMAASGACNAFAAGVRAEDCRAAKFSAAGANPFANADVTAETLFDGPQAKDGARKKLTVDNTVGSNENTAMEAFVRNMGSPLELRALGPGELGTDAGRRYLAVKDSFESRMSLATYPVRRHVGMISPSASTKPVLERLVASVDGDFVQAYLNKSFPQWAAKGISSDDLMQLEVQRRYMNKGWMTRAAATMSPEEVARETLINAAFQNVLLLNMNQELRNNGVLLGTLNAAAVRQESLPELKAAHVAAAR